METLAGLVVALIYVLKILAWLFPIIGFVVIFRRLADAGLLSGVQRKLIFGFGLTIGILLRYADTRDFIGVGYVASKFEVGFFDAEHFWHGAYFAFWTEWVNPLRYPFADAFARLAGAPDYYVGAGAAGLLLVFLALAAVTIDRAHRLNPVAFAALSLLAIPTGFYVVYWLTWLWAIVGLAAAALLLTMFRSRLRKQVIFARIKY